MKREVRIEDISDGRLYHSNDFVKIGCNDCSGCHACCKEMEALVLDPYDIYRMKAGLFCHFEELLERGVCLHKIDGLLLPVMDTSSGNHQCNFLNADGRCGIHSFRPGICRLFPLARYYHDDSFSYIIQKDQCMKKGTTKVKIKKWLGYDDIKQYETYILKWHTFIIKIQNQLSALSEEQLRILNVYVLRNFYQFHFENDFFHAFDIQLEKAYNELGLQ